LAVPVRDARAADVDSVPRRENDWGFDRSERGSRDCGVLRPIGSGNALLIRMQAILPIMLAVMFFVTALVAKFG